MDHGQDHDVVVIGAGLAGLTAAAVAAERTSRVLVLDNRAPGGRARTDEREGFRFNQGAHALYRGGAGRGVLRRLGIAPTGAAPPLDATFGWRDGELHPLPTNGRSLMTTTMLSIRSKAQIGRLLAGLPRIDPGPLAAMSGTEYIDSHDLRPDARGLVETLARVATYTDDFDHCSADVVVSQLQSAAAHGVDYLDGGWRQLTDALVRVLHTRGAVISADRRALAVRRQGDGWLVSTSHGDLRADAVVVASGGPAAAAGLLEGVEGFAGPAAWELGPDSTAACLQLGLRRPPPTRVLFGVEQPVYLSTHAPPADLAPEGGAVVEVLRYGATTTQADEAQLWEVASAAGITEADVVTERFLHRMVVLHGMARPGVGLVGRPSATMAEGPGLFVAGDWVGPVGWLADASFASGEVAGRAAADHAARRRLAA